MNRRPAARRCRVPALIAVLVLAFSAAARAAPDAAWPEADPADVESVDAIIAAYYEVVSGPAGSTPDIVRDRSLHRPDAWVAIVQPGDDGSKAVMRGGVDDYYGIEPGATPPVRTAGFFEWETGREVRRHGDMVHVWSEYASAAAPRGEGEVGATGVNSITLYFDGTRWWIMGWMFDATGTETGA